MYSLKWKFSWIFAAKSVILRCYNQFQDPVGTEVIIFRNEEGFRGSGMCSLHPYCFNKCYLGQSKQITSKTRGWGWWDLATLNEWFIKAYKNKKQHKPVLTLFWSAFYLQCSAAIDLSLPKLEPSMVSRQFEPSVSKSSYYIQDLLSPTAPPDVWCFTPLSYAYADARFCPTPCFGPEIQLKDIVLW